MSASACAWPVNSCRHAGLGQPLLPGARLDRLEGQTALPELVSCLLSLAAGGRARVGHAVLPPKLHVASRRLGAGGARHCRSAVRVTALPRGRDALQHDLGHGGGVNWLADDVSKRAGAEQRLNDRAGVMWA